MSEAYFPTTLWTEVELAGTRKGDAADKAFDRVLNRYYQPLVNYLCRKHGLSEDEARELFHKFYDWKIANRNLLGKADRTKGSFRNYVRNCLDKFLVEAWRKRTAQKRMPQGGLHSLEEMQAAGAEPTCEDRYTEECADATIQRALELMREDCLASGRDRLWEIFKTCVFDPIMEGSKSPPAAGVFQRFGLRCEGSLHKAVYDSKKCFGAALKKALAESVGQGGDIEEERRELIRELSVRNRRGLRML